MGFLGVGVGIEVGVGEGGSTRHTLFVDSRSRPLAQSLPCSYCNTTLDCVPQSPTPTLPHPMHPTSCSLCTGTPCAISQAAPHPCHHVPIPHCKLQGAGGVITDWAGRPLQWHPESADAKVLPGEVVAAGGAATHAEALKILDWR